MREEGHLTMMHCPEANDESDDGDAAAHRAAHSPAAAAQPPPDLTTLSLPKLEQHAATLQSELDELVRVKTAELHRVKDRIECLKEARRERKRRGRRRCSAEGCGNVAKNNDLCIRHGAAPTNCSVDGCQRRAVTRGVCHPHGAVVPLCQSDGCALPARMKGWCRKHSPKCAVEGCARAIVRKGRCNAHAPPSELAGTRGGYTGKGDDDLIRNLTGREPKGNWRELDRS